MSEVETGTDDVALSPLLRRDPPVVGDVELTGRLAGHDAGLMYAGRVVAARTSPSQDVPGSLDTSTPDAADGHHPVVVIMLTAGAETDAYARARFRTAIQDLDSDQPETVVASEDEEDLAPWVAVSAGSWAEGLTLGERLLKAVTLEDQAPVGVVQGPDFRPHWWNRVGVGRWRLWPLPWPSRLSTAGRWTFLASFAVICAIAALALWIAILVFRNQPPPAPTPGPGPGPNPPSTPTQPPTTPSPGPTPNPNGPPGHSIPPIV